MTSMHYDIFVSFKALDGEGKPTRDSALAKEIYEFLTARGFNVFYSRISLEQLGVSGYKRAIDDALDASRVLVAVGTSARHLDSQWVRYEWDSFYSDTLSGVKPDGRVFVYLENVELGALPRALRQSQAISHGAGSLEMLCNFVANALRCMPSGPAHSQTPVDVAASPSGQSAETSPRTGIAKSDRTEDIERQLNCRILGQEGAIARLAPWIRRLRLGIKRQSRPAAVFLFVGPTCTGKTKLAQEIARFVYGDPAKMVFMDMAQFGSPGSVSGFIGAPPGYAGDGQGLLSRALRDMPECVVILDEIGETHASVFGVVMRFLDESVVWDPDGPVRDGRGCIVIMTTNAGQTWFREELGKHPESLASMGALEKGALDAAVAELSKKGIGPEFLKRVDEVITFMPFSESTCRKLIDELLAGEVAKFGEKGIALSVADSARDNLAHRAYDRSLYEGARGAMRVVNEYLVGPAIDLASGGKYEGMPSAIAVTASADGEITLSVLPRQQS